MALKLKINKEAFDALPAVLQAEYRQIGDEWHLDADVEDTGALRRAHDRTKEELTEARRLAKEAQEKLDALGDDGARRAGDIATLEKSWKTKLDSETAARDAKIKTLETGILSSAIEAATTTLTSKLTDKAALITPHIRARITAEIGDNGQPVIRYLDKTGQPSAMTADDLQKEFANNPDFSSIIRVSKASGGGAGGAADGKGSRGGASGHGQNEKPDLSKMSHSELTAYMKAKSESEGED
jgi:hypothetical protein